MADDYYNDPILDYGTLLLNFGGQIANVAAQKDAQRMKLMEYGVQAERQQLDDMIQISNYRAKQAAERVDQLTAQNVNNNIQSMLKNSQPGGNQGAALMTMFALKDMEGTQGFKRLMEKYPNLDEHYNTAMRHVLTPTGSGPGAAPDWSNILANRGKDGEFAKPAAYEDVMKVSMQTPPEQRPALWQALGYPLQAIQYDRATGLPTTTPDQLPDYMRAALMSRNEGIPFNDVVMTKQGAQQVAPGAVPLDDNTLAIPGALSRVKLQEFGGIEALKSRMAGINALKETSPLDAYLGAVAMQSQPGLSARLGEVAAGVSKDSPLASIYGQIDPAKAIAEINQKKVMLNGEEITFAGAMARARAGDQGAVASLLSMSKSDPYALKPVLESQGIAVTDGVIQKMVDMKQLAVAPLTETGIAERLTGGMATLGEVRDQYQNIIMMGIPSDKNGVTGESMAVQELDANLATMAEKIPNLDKIPVGMKAALVRAKPEEREAIMGMAVQKAEQITIANVDRVKMIAGTSIRESAANYYGMTAEDLNAMPDRGASVISSYATKLKLNDPKALEVLDVQAIENVIETLKKPDMLGALAAYNSESAVAAMKAAQNTIQNLTTKVLPISGATKLTEEPVDVFAQQQAQEASADMAEHGITFGTP